jgi:dynein regulatory complex protein 1
MDPSASKKDPPRITSSTYTCFLIVQEIEEQKALCAEVVAAKDKVISSFYSEIRNKEQEFVKSLSKQAKDVDTLVKKMRQQYKRIQQGQDKELSTLEETFDEERKALRGTNNSELDALFEDRRNKES